jgi:microcystin-dependent protein
MRKHMNIVLVFVILATLSLAQLAQASDPFIGEIRLFAGNFAPRGWAFCHGQLLSISDHTALFSILGTTYGGDGRTTFGLPDLRGRVPIAAGNGPGLTPRPLGTVGGQEEVRIEVAQLPAHTHQAWAVNKWSNKRNPKGKVWARKLAYRAPQDEVKMNEKAIGTTGQGQPVEIMPPFQALNYIIALQGIFPSRS